MALKRMLFASLFLACFMLKPTSQLEMENNYSGRGSNFGSWHVSRHAEASFKTEGARVTLETEPISHCYNAKYSDMQAKEGDNYWEFTCTGACKVKIGFSKFYDWGNLEDIKGFFFNGTDVEDYVSHVPKLPVKNGKPISSGDRIGFILNLEKSKLFISHNESPMGLLRLPRVYNSYRQQISPTIIFCSTGTVDIREVEPIVDVIGR